MLRRIGSNYYNLNKITRITVTSVENKWKVDVYGIRPIDYSLFVILGSGESTVKEQSCRWTHDTAETTHNFIKENFYKD